MPELRRLARLIRCNNTSPQRLFVHRLSVGLAVAALILLFSVMR